MLTPEVLSHSMAFGTMTKMGGQMIITPEIRQAIDSAGDQPVRLEDLETHRTYILISAEVFEKMRAQLSQDPVDQMARFLDETFDEGWNDPALDVYNDKP